MSTPAHQVVGHLIHLDDGMPVATGSYPFSVSSFAETLRFLRRDEGDTKPTAERWTANDCGAANSGYHGIVLKFSGNDMSIGELAGRISHEKAIAKECGLYLITVAWCAGSAAQIEALLTRSIETAELRVKVRGDDLDKLVEGNAHVVGRALRRDLETAALNTTLEGSVGMGAIEGLIGLSDYGLHIIADGAGAILLAEVMRRLRSARLRRTHDRLLDRLRTVDMITPEIDARRLIRDLKPALKEGSARLTLHVPSAATEARLAVGAYSMSSMHLIENSFSPPSSPRPNLIGKSLPSILARDDALKGELPDRLEWREIELEAPKGERLSQKDLQRKTNLMSAILRSLAPAPPAREE